MWRLFLSILFGAILTGMLIVTIIASMHRNVFDAGYLFNDPWFVATFCDAYFGFLTFYVWVAYKENSHAARILWFVAIMCLGNIAMAVYMLIQLAMLPKGGSMRDLLVNTKKPPN